MKSEKTPSVQGLNSFLARRKIQREREKMHKIINTKLVCKSAQKKEKKS